MKKEERIAMVGHSNVHWWTLERIVFFVSLAVVLLASYAYIVHNFLPMLTGSVMVFGFILGVFLCGSLSLIRGEKVSEVSLQVRRLDKNLGTAKVVGKDGKEHTVEIDSMEANRDAPLTYVIVWGRLKDDFWVDLTIGSNISEVWKEPKKK